MTKATIYWRLLGTVSSGLIAYFGFAPLTVLRAIPLAIIWTGGGFANLCQAIWRNRELIKWNINFILMAASWPLLFFASMFFSGTNLSGFRSATLTDMYWMLAVPPGLSLFLGICARLGMEEKKSAADLRRMVFRRNPIVVLGYYLPLLLFRIVVFLLRHLPSFLFWHLPCFFFRFSRRLFLLIHCQERTICLIDGIIGAAVLGSILDIDLLTARLIGAVIGGLFGVLNYELVSKYWLRLHLPERRSRLLSSW